MKKILLMFAAVAALGFSSCNETWDDNPVLSGHEGVKTADFLNNPVMQDQTIMITNDNKEGTFHLTCSQPEVGYAAVLTYRVQCSLTQDFTEYIELSQSFYDCSQINPVNSEVAAAIEKLSGVKTEADLPLPYKTLYMRLRAFLGQSPENTQYLSNVVSFKGVSADYLAIWVAGAPVNIYMRGGMNEWGADKKWQFKTGEEEDTWVCDGKTEDNPDGKLTIAAGTEFKVADAEWGSLNLGSGEAEIKPNEEYALNGGENPGNIKMAADFTGKAVLTLKAGVYYLVLDPEI